MRRVSIFLWITSCLFTSWKVQAQTISAGVKGGISIPNLTSGGSNPLDAGYSTRVGADFALFGEYSISRLFSLEAALEYSSQGGKKNGNQALPVPDLVASQFPLGQAPPYLWATFNSAWLLH